MMVMLKSIFENNRKSIITMLNKVLYLSDIRYMKRRYGHKAIKLLKVEYES